jgi:hypothetical protein
MSKVVMAIYHLSVKVIAAPTDRARWRRLPIVRDRGCTISGWTVTMISATSQALFILK